MSKLKKIIIEHIKNVNHGEVSFSDKNSFLNVTGIYGQNGSGKTTLIDVFSLVQNLLLGQTIPANISGMLTDSQPAYFQIEIEVENQRQINYELTFEKNRDLANGVTITSEVISTKVLEKRKVLRKIFSYDSGEEDEISFGTQERLLGREALSIITSMSRSAGLSVLFNPELVKNIQNAKKKDELKEVVNQLISFASNLRIYTSEYAGLISANIMTPVTVSYVDNVNHKRFQGILPFQLSQGQNFIPEALLDVYKRMLEQMNVLIPAIIPDLTLDFQIVETRVNQQGKKELNLAFLANRSGKQFSLAYESDGIKKIIGLISYLVEVYNKPNIVALIDELDSGIFEYLLGELIDIFGTGAQGQLIFTSHNLRVLELLPKNKIVFTTTNPDNRYIRLRGVKTTNNLRDFYIRALLLGGQEEELYEGKSSSNIRRALRKAGRANEK